MARCLLVEEGLGCLRVGEGTLAMEPKANNQRSLTKSTKGRLVKEIFLSLQQSKGEVLKKKKIKVSGGSRRDDRERFKTPPMALGSVPQIGGHSLVADLSQTL